MSGAAKRQHVTAAELRAVITAPSTIDPRVEKHLAACAECRADLELVRQLRACELGEPRACPDPEQLLRYLEHALERHERELIDDHLTECRDCASEVDRHQRAATSRSAPRTATRKLDMSMLAESLRRWLVFELPPAPAWRSGGASEFLARALDEHEAGDRDGALATLREAVEADEADPDARFLLGTCLLEAGQAEPAVAELQRAVDSRPRRGEYRWYLAQALVAVGREAEALVQVERVARVPGQRNEAARDILRRLEEGSEARRDDDSGT